METPLVILFFTLVLEMVFKIVIIMFFFFIVSHIYCCISSCVGIIFRRIVICLINRTDSGKEYS